MWGATLPLAVALSSGSSVISFYLEKFFGTREDNCSQVKVRLRNDLRLLKPTHNMFCLFDDQTLEA
jgi:hypothetical protein